MKPARAFPLVGVLAAVLAGGFAAGPQQPVPPPPPEAGPPIRVEVDVVNVVFSVTDRRSRNVTDLGLDDFVVREDGVPQEIRFFRSQSELPLRIGLLIDTSNSVRPRFQFEQEAAVDFLHTILRPKTDLAFVMSFDVEPILARDFTDDPLDLADSIRGLRAGGITTLYDAIYLGCKVKLADGSGGDSRKMLIVLSDGEDNISVVSRKEALEMCQRHEVTIFTVSTGAPPVGEHTDKAKHLMDPCKVSGEEGDKVLRYFAESTGGTAYCPFSTVDVGQSFERIVNELRSQYSLGYSPTNRLRDGHFRQITIETRRQGLRVHHRPGYYATLPPAAATSPSDN